MRRLVRDDVVRQRGEHGLAGQVRAGVVVGGGEVPEQQGEQLIVEVGVLAQEGMRIDAQPAPAAPAERSSERPFVGLR